MHLKWFGKWTRAQQREWEEFNELNKTHIVRACAMGYMSIGFSGVCDGNVTSTLRLVNVQYTKSTNNFN